MFEKVKKNKSKSDAVGAVLASVLPDDNIHWYKKRHLVWLAYFGINISLLAAANGYDGSMMNGLLALPEWMSFMKNPTGAWLGFISASQSLSSACAYPIVAYFGNRWGRKKGNFVG